MTTFDVLKNSLWALFNIPILLIQFMGSLIRRDDRAAEILEDEVPLMVFLLTPLVYILCMIIALVTLIGSGGIRIEFFQWMVLVFCIGWIIVTFLLGLQHHHARIIQAQSIHYYLLFMAFLQTLFWVIAPDNPKNEPSSVLILFLATSVSYINEKLIKPMIEDHHIVHNEEGMYTVRTSNEATKSNP